MHISAPPNKHYLLLIFGDPKADLTEKLARFCEILLKPPHTNCTIPILAQFYLICKEVEFCFLLET